MIGGDTSDPDRLESAIKDILMKAKTTDFANETLDRTKKKKIGAFLRAINSPEYIANQFTRYAFNEMNLFDVVPAVEEITVEDIKNAANKLLAEERITTCQVVPK